MNVLNDYTEFELRNIPSNQCFAIISYLKHTLKIEAYISVDGKLVVKTIHKDHQNIIKELIKDK